MSYLIPFLFLWTLYSSSRTPFSPCPPSRQLHSQSHLRTPKAVAHRTGGWGGWIASWKGSRKLLGRWLHFIKEKMEAFTFHALTELTERVTAPSWFSGKHPRDAMRQGNHAPFHDPSWEKRFSGVYFRSYEAVVKGVNSACCASFLLLGGRVTSGLSLNH